MNLVEKVDIIPSYRTDHSSITLELKLTDFKRGKGFWKFNSSLIHDRTYIEKVEDTIRKTKLEYCLPVYNIDKIDEIDDEYLYFTISDQLFFEMLLMNIRSLTISYSAEKQRKKNERKKNI